jgi:hypothetical protein
MAIKFRKQAIKFVEKADPETLSRIQDRLNQLLLSVEERSLIPFTELDIKQMKGDWEGFDPCGNGEADRPPQRHGLIMSSNQKGRSPTSDRPL